MRPENALPLPSMFEVLFDGGLIDRVAAQIARDDHPGLEEARAEILALRERLTAGVRQDDCLRTIDDYRRLEPQQLSDLAFRTDEDVVSFVSSVISYYREVKASRPLTEEEKRAGTGLLRLLEQVKDHLPKLATQASSVEESR